MSDFFSDCKLHYASQTLKLQRTLNEIEKRKIATIEQNKLVK